MNDKNAYLSPYIKLYATLASAVLCGSVQVETVEKGFEVKTAGYEEKNISDWGDITFE